MANFVSEFRSQIANKFGAAKLEWAQRGKLHVVNLIRDRFLSGQVLKRRTGTLVRSIQSESAVIDTRDGFVVGTNLGYGVMWETTGHKSYTITPKNAKALRFTAGGQVVFSRSALIPAAPARPFIKPGLDMAEPYLTELAAQLTGKAALDAFPGTRLVTIALGKI